MFVGCWGLKPRWLLVCLVVSCSLFGGKGVGAARGQTRKCARSAEKCAPSAEMYARSAHFFGVGYEGGGLCRVWEALAGYLGGLSCRQGRGVSHTPLERHHRWRIHVPHSASSGPPKRAYAIRPYSRVPGQTSPASVDAPTCSFMSPMVLFSCTMRPESVLASSAFTPASAEAGKLLPGTRPNFAGVRRRPRPA